MDSLRQKLIGLINATKRKKPYRCEVEYLESTGTQWIDTGINVDTSTDEIKLYFELTDTALYKWLFGEYDNNARLGLGSGDGTDKRNFLYQQSATKVSDTQMYNKQHLFEINSNGGFLDGTKIRSYTSFASTSSIYLFNLNIDSPSDYRCKSKIWKYEHKRNGVLVSYMIPVLDWNNKPALYDRVTGKLFYNKDTSGNDFVYGREIHRVEYLESTGVQYIDTGHAFTDNFSWEIDFEGITGGTTLFGGRTSSTRTALLYQRNYGGVDLTTCPIAGYNGQETPFQLTDLRLGRHIIKMSVASNKGSVWVDGTQVYNEQAFTGTYISGTTQALFADNFGSSVSEYTSSKVYALKMLQGSTFVRDYIPAIDENGVGFMFDRVTHTIFDNKGTGIGFKYPPVEVEYLESTGTQYINTGLLSTANSKVDAEFSFTSMESGVANNCAVFGGRNQPNSTVNTFVLFKIASGNPQYFRFDYNSQQTVGTASEMTWNTASKYRFQYDGTNCITTNITTGERAAVALSPASSFTEQPIYLFCVNSAGARGNAMAGRIYKYWYTDGTNTIKLVPAIKDGKGCMYDKITRTVYENLGTDDFIIGRIKEKK